MIQAEEQKLRKKITGSAWKANNRDKMNSYKAKYRAANRDKLAALFAAYRAANRHKVLASRAAYKAKPEVKAQIISYENSRRRTNPMFREAHIQRARIHAELKKRGIAKTCRTASVIGCDWKFLCQYLETRFKPGMTWENRGKVWHVDHVIPLASAKTKAELHRLCHYTNLNPEFAEENLAKSDKMLIQQNLI